MFKHSSLVKGKTQGKPVHLKARVAQNWFTRPQEGTVFGEMAGNPRAGLGQRGVK